MRNRLVFLAASIVTLSALAQSPAMKPFDINLDRVKV